MTTSWIRAMAARAAFGITYHHAAVTLDASSTGTRLTMRRHGTPPAALDVRYRPVGPASSPRRWTRSSPIGC